MLDHFSPYIVVYFNQKKKQFASSSSSVLRVSGVYWFTVLQNLVYWLCSSVLQIVFSNVFVFSPNMENQDSLGANYAVLIVWTDLLAKPSQENNGNNSGSEASFYCTSCKQKENQQTECFQLEDGNYVGAIRLVIEFKEGGLKPEVYSYLIAMTALVKEQKELSKVLRKLKASIKDGLITDLDEESTLQIEKYQSDLIKDGVRLSVWAIHEGGSVISGLVHERLLALYTCAGCGVEAEYHIWQMKLLGKEPDRVIYDAVLAICASKNEVGAVRRLLAGVEARSAELRKQTFSWLLRGYIKGGYYVNASETIMKMLDLGLSPEYLDRAAVLQGLRKRIHESGDVEPYLKLCKRLSDMEVIGPCLMYMYIQSRKLWITRMI